MDWNWYNWT